jgi:DNA polymerase elongation subunit (family B)
MKQQKVDLSPKELFKNFKEGSPDKIKEIAVYCIMDCKLVNDLINKLQVITNNLGMSNVCVVPFSYLFLRGQGIKIFSLVAKFCREENFLIKDLSIDDIDKNSYEGAIVFVPEPGIYFEPIVVMDYNSLYPSSIISKNVSH